MRNKKMITLAKTIYFHNERDPKGYLHTNLLPNAGISPHQSLSHQSMAHYTEQDFSFWQLDESSQVKQVNR